MSKRIPEAESKILYGRANARCSFPGCLEDLTIESEGDKTRQIGKMAHIIAKSKNGPRADNSYPKEKLNTYENLILLCGKHHDVIDSLVNEYPAERLRKMKKDHEDLFRRPLEKRIQQTGFAELKIAIDAILSNTSMVANSSFEVTPPEEKIKKNNLTESTKSLIVMGMSRGYEIKKYIERQSKLDENYPERLKKGFRDKYDELVKNGMSGDVLFESMREFSSDYSDNFSRQAAGLIVLTHLFELCEIFEK